MNNGPDNSLSVHLFEVWFERQVRMSTLLESDRRTAQRTWAAAYLEGQSNRGRPLGWIDPDALKGLQDNFASAEVSLAGKPNPRQAIPVFVSTPQSLIPPRSEEPSSFEAPGQKGIFSRVLSLALARSTL
ncbi:hypothetical protein F6X40_27945 [Paraburkholderia sp. UCT31]|uniref:hypothetical protein n=1 Tax=Paraburkholderia sp. UCT31 TaxID=2615209 RepID=UPI00165647F3|nr:hypothetical protein [Paraburkholderia sp. UCT31]MBC8740473.1 hypothetical protein [Paraburkholderia sp. UCT31]